MEKLKEEMMWGATLSLTMRQMPMLIAGINSIGAQMGKMLSVTKKGTPEYRRLNYLLTGIGGIHQILQAVDGMASAMSVDLMGGLQDGGEDSHE